MAEFCLDCWNKLNGTHDSKRKYVISKDLDLCEGCGEYKHVIVRMKRYYCMRTLDVLLIPVKLIFLPLIIIHEIIHRLTPGR